MRVELKTSWVEGRFKSTSTTGVSRMATIDSTSGVLSGIANNLTNVFDGGTDNISVGTVPSALLNTDTTDKTKTELTPAVAAVAPAAVAPAVVAPETTETPLTFSNVRTSEAPVPVAMVDVDVNGKTQQVAVNPAATGTTSTATSAVEGASAEEVKAFNSVLADVDAKVGKTASNATERAKNVAEFRSKLSGSKLTEFDASMKSAAEKTGANFGRNEWKTDASKLSAGTQAVLSKYAAGQTATPKTEVKKSEATSTAAKTETATPAAKSTAIQGNVPQKFSDATSEELRKINGKPNYMIDAALVEGNANADGNKVTKAGLSKVVSPQAAAELNAYVFKGKEFASATDVRNQLRAAYEGDQALRR
jgi:hypothetical protein